jgi:hypothetical protein
MRNQSGRWGVDEEVSENPLRNGTNHSFLVPEATQPGTPGSLPSERMQKNSTGGGKWTYSGLQPKGKTEIPF